MFWTDNAKLFIPLLTALLCLTTPQVQATQTLEQLRQSLKQSAPADKGRILTKLVRLSRANDPHGTIALGEQALAHFESNPDDKRKVTVLNNMAWAHKTLGQYQQAEQRAKAALALSLSGEDHHGTYASLNMLGLIYWQTSRYQAAIDAYSRGLSEAESIEDEQAIGTTLNNIAIIYDILGESQKALGHFLQSLHAKQMSKNMTGAAIVMNNIAEIYLKYGNYSLALQYQLQSLHIREQVNDLPGIAEVTGNLGITYFKLNKPQQAIDHYRRSLTLYRQLNDKLGVAESHNNLGKFYQNAKQYDQAMTHFTQTLQIAKQIQNKAMQTRVLINIAGILTEQDKLSEANNSINKGLQLAEQLKIKTLISQGLQQQAKLLLTMEQPTQAEQQIKRSLALAIELNDKAQIANGYKLLSDIQQKIKKPWQALASFEKYKAVNDEIYNSTSDQRIALLQVHFKAQKQQTEIALLKADKALAQSQLARQSFERNAYLIALLLAFFVTLLMLFRYHQNKVNRTLKHNIQSQQQLIRAIAHEFRAPLARVQLAFDLLFEAPEQDAYNQDLGKRINQGLDELESLVKEALEFIRNENQSARLERTEVRLKPIIDKLFESHSLQYGDKQFVYKCTQEDVRLFADAQQLNRILVNLIGNAARYAEKTVAVSCVKVKNGNEIRIEDDGPGIAPQNAERVFEPFVRLDPSRARNSGGIGLGLSLVKSIATAHGATVKILSSKLGGTQVLLHWPDKTRR